MLKRTLFTWITMAALFGFGGGVYAQSGEAFIPTGEFHADLERDLKSSSAVISTLSPVFKDAFLAYIDGDYKTAETAFWRVLEEFETQLNIQNQKKLPKEVIGNIEFNLIFYPFADVVDGADFTSLIVTESLYENNISLRFAEAFDARRRLVDAGDLGFPLYMKGLSLLNMDDYAGAEAAFKKVTQMDKRQFDARLRLGLSHLLKGDVKAARRQYKRLRAYQRQCRGQCPNPSALDQSVDTLGAALIRVTTAQAAARVE